MHPLRWLTLTLTLVIGFSALLAADQNPGQIVVTNQRKINDSDILAEYDGGIITRRDLEEKISKIPPNQQGRYRTVDGQIQVLEIIAVEDVYMAKALQLGIDQEPGIQERINNAARQMYVQEYYKRNISNLLVITDADRRKYYDENKQAFYLFPYISINYIQTSDEASINQAFQELKSGKSWEEVSNTYSTNNYVKGLKSVLKNIRLNGNVPGVGNDLELERYIADSKADPTIIYGPYQTSTGWHLFRTNEYVPGRQKDFEEVYLELEQRTRPGVEARMLNELTDRLKLKYEVSVDSTLIALLDLSNREKHADILDTNLVRSNNRGLLITVGSLFDKYTKLSPQEQLFYIKGQGAQQLLDQELVNLLLYLDAKEQNLGEQLEQSSEFIQMKRFFILNAIYKREVLDKPQITTEDCRAYYEARISEFMNPAHRTIQALWFDDEKTAARTLKKYQRYAKLGDEKRIADLIENYSKKPRQAVLDNLYDNGIITGIGPDAPFSKLIWDNPVGYVSPVFKNSKNEILFFRTIAEVAASPQNFTELEPRIYGILKAEKQKEIEAAYTAQLFEEFNMVQYPERVRMELSAEEMFNLADNAAKQRNFKDSITFYDQIIKNFPNGSDDYRASFMKAFIIAEELKNEELALELFQDFLRKYPSGDLNESAQFMIDSLLGNTQLELE